MATYAGPPSSAIRNRPISGELKDVLDAAAQAAGIDTVRITSGGQDDLGKGTRRTGSTRHDSGRAADLQLVVNGTTLTFTDQAAPPAVIAFVTAAANAGATGIGAGVTYMGNRTIHVGFGTSPADTTRLTWGAGGRSATAPQWLRKAAQAGWAAPAAPGASASTVDAPGRYVVLARSGLRLRGGPGTSFDSQQTLAAGTEVNVVGFSEVYPSWAQVSLEDDDDLVDGYVFAAFLGLASTDAEFEDAPEPDGPEDA